MFFNTTGYVNTAILLHIRASTDHDFLKKLTKKLTSNYKLADKLCIILIISSSVCLRRWEYVFNVISILLWPRYFETAIILQPLLIALVAKLCRKPWMVTFWLISFDFAFAFANSLCILVIGSERSPPNRYKPFVSNSGLISSITMLVKLILRGFPVFVGNSPFVKCFIDL